ncbi:hypothetical protein N7468_000105 [Penicillium chermesinum]|uniref:DUF7779 domain-containing protein n=1 Tax=Penicillium chermesinum TaxID=63820 RepID=A0A9W9PKZ8_9EURO|nr:uncharacterized protein N7468_000105 [Penicillium chermesinum]KAJ5248654.1 hypothetical protein N7468_000105 [Penicillium chermesinum]
MAPIVFSGTNNALQIGIHYGDIYLPERPETPPAPLSTAPERERDFTGRNILLDQIHNKNSVHGSRIALVGLGGVGKSQIAIEYSYQVRSKSPTTWVFWVHASNEFRFTLSLQDLADRVKIPGRKDPGANIFRLVENWLQDEKRDKWVLILDNADDHEFLCSPPAMSNTGVMAGLTKPLFEYLPRRQNGFIIITSRTRETALKMVHPEDILQVEPMNSLEASELLLRKLNGQDNSDECRQLVEELEYMPLAITQAASYIWRRRPRSSVARYLKDLKRGDREATELLQGESFVRERDSECRRSILLTWQISFNYIKRTRPSAAALLSLMSFFDRRGIPDFLVRKQPHCTSNIGDSDSSGSGTSFEFEDDILVLREYSFISIGENDTILTMHRLVQLSTHAWLESHQQLDQYREMFIDHLHRDFPTGEFENWAVCRSLFPHVRSASDQRPVSPESRLKWATVLARGVQYACETGYLRDVKNMAMKSREQRMALLSEDNKEVLDSAALLAWVYSAEGSYNEAEKLIIKNLSTLKAKHGEDHPVTLMNMADLGQIYCSQGRFEEAEELLIGAVEARKRNLGEDNPQTWQSMAELAATYTEQGRFEEAQQLHIQIMESRKRRLGIEHPETLTSVANLASTYWSQGRFKEAEDLFVESLETRIKCLGKDHPHTLQNVENLAATYSMQGQGEEAEKLYLDVIETRRDKLGKDHPATLKTMATLARIYGRQGRWDEKENLEVQIVESHKMKLGEDHLNTLVSMRNLVSTYMSLGRWKEAETLNCQRVETCKIKFGVDHDNTLASMVDLASIYWNLGRLEETKTLEIQVMETFERKLGADHPSTLKAMRNLSETYGSMGQWEDAEKILVPLMNIEKAQLGEDHPDTLNSMNNLAMTYMKLERWNEAEQLIIQVLETRTVKFGVDNHATLISMANLAFVWMSLGHETQAIDLIRDSVAGRKRLGYNDPETLSNAETLLEWEAKRLNIDS